MLSSKHEVLYPLKFVEGTRDYFYGGHKLRQLLNKDFPEDKLIAESWEIYDQSVVRNGRLKGRVLSELLKKFPVQLLAPSAQEGKQQFPLLLKFLDINKLLPVQIHPTDAFVQANGLGQRGKAEAWYIIHAEEDSSIFYGTKAGLGKAEIVEILQNQPASLRMSSYVGELRQDLKPTLLHWLKAIKVHAGDVVYIPPGRPHAASAGIVLFEIQQNSDITILPDLLFQDGQIVEETMGEKGFQMFRDQLLVEDVPIDRITIPAIEICEGRNKRRILQACRFFALESLHLEEPWHEGESWKKDRFVILTVLQGSGEIAYAGGKEPFEKGETLLIPSSIPQFSIHPAPRACLLKSYIPDLRKDIVKPLLESGQDVEAISALGGYGVGNDLLSLL